MNILCKNFEILKENYSQLYVETLYNEAMDTVDELDYSYMSYEDEDERYENENEPSKQIDPNIQVINKLVDWYEDTFGELNDDDRCDLIEMIKEEFLFLDD